MSSDKSREPLSIPRSSDVARSAHSHLRTQEGQEDLFSTNGYGKQVRQAMSGYSQLIANYGNQVMQSMNGYVQPALIQAKSAGMPNQKTPSPLTPLTFTQKLSGYESEEKESKELSSIGMLQRKLTIGVPNDPYEQEADAVADQVMRMTAHTEQSPEITNTGEGKPLQRKCHACEEEKLVQRVTITGGEIQAPNHLASRLQARHGQGSPLAPAIQAKMGQAFSTDFSPVRIHTDAEAIQMSQNLNAQAFTHGSDIYFNQGKYNPGTTNGTILLAHELTHTVQQANTTNTLSPHIQRSPLDDCIAELGGSPRYRDGGLATQEELEQYRRECERRLDTTQGTQHDGVQNLLRAWEYARVGLDEEIVREVEHLFTPQSLAMMAAFAVLYIGSQMTPAGWIADALALTVLTLSFVFVGGMVISIGNDIFTFFSAVNATTDAELRVSGDALRRALAQGGVAIFLLIVSGAMRAGTRPTPPTGTAPALVEAVAPNGARVSVAVSTVQEATQTSRLQALGSYAVMGPPPGGSRSDDTSGRGSSSERRPGPAATSGFSLQRIPYGNSPLCTLAQSFRLLRGLRSGHNIAVFEFESISPRFKAIIERLGGDHVAVDGNRLVVQNVNEAAHSEVLADQLISTARRAGTEANVTRIYSEYNPCSDMCLPLIRRNYPNAQVTYSFVWERWGRETSFRNAEVEALFERSGQ